MNAGIILSGRGPNIVNALAQGAQAADLANQVQQQNALRGAYAEHGAGLVNNDPNAVNALATLDPQAALGIKGYHSQEARADRTEARQNRQLDLQEQRLSAAEARQVQEYRLKVGEVAAQQEAAQAEKLLFDAAILAQSGDLAGVNKILMDGNLSPVPLENIEDFAIVAGKSKAVIDAMKVADDLGAQPAPLTDEGKRKADIGAGWIDPNQQPAVDLKEVDKFRKEFSTLPAVKNFSLQTEGMTRIVAAAETPSAAGDLSLIFNFMKVLDPNSVVRESEFATAEAATAWLQESQQLGVDVPRPVASAIRKIATGERMSVEQRADFVGTAAGIYKKSEGEYRNIRGQFETIAEARGYPLDQALIDFSFSGSLPGDEAAPASSQQSGPQFQFENDTQRALFDKYGGS